MLAFPSFHLEDKVTLGDQNEKGEHGEITPLKYTSCRKGKKNN